MKVLFLTVCLIVFSSFFFSLGGVFIVFASTEHEDLVNDFVADGTIPSENEAYADAVVRGVGGSVSLIDLTELFISYAIIPTENIEAARAYVGATSIPETSITVQLDSTSPAASVIEVDATAITEDILSAVATLSVEGGDVELFELPIVVQTGIVDVDLVVDEVQIVINGSTYTTDTFVDNGTSYGVTFYFGANHTKPVLRIAEGDSIEVQILVSFQGREGVYANGETIDTSITDEERDAIASKKILEDTTPYILAELLVAHSIIAPGDYDEAKDLADLFSDSQAIAYVEACISSGIISGDSSETARDFLYDVYEVSLYGNALGETHTLMQAGIFSDLITTDAVTESYNHNDDVLGIFTFQFDFTASLHTYYISATSTSVFDYNITDGDGIPLLFSISSSSLRVETSAERDGDWYRIPEGETESFTVMVTIFPGAAGEYQATLNSVWYGSSTVFSLGDVRAFVSDEEGSFVTDPIDLEEYVIPDTTPPIITLVGDVYIEIAKGSAYVDPGAYAEDETDGTLTDLIEFIGDIDTNTVDTYTRVYRIYDAANNEASTTRTVRVYGISGGGIRDTDPPHPINVDIVESTTTNRKVHLTLSAQDASRKIYMQVSEDEVFDQAVWVPFQKTTTFTLSEGFGIKKVFVHFRDAKENTSGLVSDTVEYVSVAQTPRGQVYGSERYFFNNDMELGMEGVDVYELQKRLKEEGFFTFASTTGYFGAYTKEAVRRYQAQYSVDQTGYVGPLTRGVLNRTIENSGGELQHEEVVQFLDLLMLMGIMTEEDSKRSLALFDSL